MEYGVCTLRHEQLRNTLPAAKVIPPVAHFTNMV